MKSSSLLVELIFRGSLPSVNLNFLNNLVVGARELYFNSPEMSTVKTLEEVLEILNLNDYVDLVINTDELNMYKKNIPKVFINLGRNNDEIEVLLFFDVMDIKEPTLKTSMDFLKKWAIEYMTNYNFNYFICQMDNGEKEEYYFDSNGPGKLYYGIGLQ